MTTTLFRFNGDYSDLEQVAEYLPEFEAVLAELEAAGEYRYNDSFKGRIAGIANTEKRGPNVGTHEDTAIYLLQGLERKRREDERVEALLADGYEFIEALDETTRFANVVLVPTGRMNGSWAEYAGARVVPTTHDAQVKATGALWAVLPKGKRTNGHYINGRKVLVKR